MSSTLGPTRAEDRDLDPAVQEIAAWVDQLQRTLKVCRLYDNANPTVVRFQQDLAASLLALLARRGALHLQVGPSTISCGGHTLGTARSQDDNFAAVLYRDGIRVLTIESGVEAREVDSLVEQILQVTGLSAGDDDLVTLLWDANLPHVVVETVPLEGEADGGLEEEGDRPTGAAWPRQEPGGAPAAVGGPPAAPAESAGGPAAAGDAPRSDDWRTGEGLTDVESVFDALETGALVQIARFQREHDAAAAERISTGVARVLRDCFADNLTAADRADLGTFAPRVLRDALGLGDWPAASVALSLARSCDPGWPVEQFCGELCNSFAITTRRVVDSLDRQDQQEVESFLSLAREFGPPVAEWLLHVLAESQQMRVRRPLARAIGELLAGNPEKIIPWLSDGRWYVVRNAVHILGWIGAHASVNYLRVPAQHPEPRVRREVVAALGQASHDDARPILIIMAAAAEPALFVMIVRQLAQDEHSSVLEWLLSLLRSETFAQRPEEERRAVFQALATRGDAVVPQLEDELNSGGLLSRRPETDRTAIALCLARIGTSAARAALERGTRSRRAAVRKACSIAGATGGVGLD